MASIQAIQTINGALDKMYSISGKTQPKIRQFISHAVGMVNIVNKEIDRLSNEHDNEAIQQQIRYLLKMKDALVRFVQKYQSAAEEPVTFQKGLDELRAGLMDYTSNYLQNLHMFDKNLQHKINTFKVA